MEWQDMESAPRDGNVILVNYNGLPILVSWSEIEQYETVTTKGWCFERTVRRKIESTHGWRPVMLDRDFKYVTHGNYNSIEPLNWLPYSDKEEEL